ncbi:MAG: hypothetical protein R3191_07635 [Anaerolineales bacterium]|nr:hypothetical protein [Anaerolineales bacterium]
MPIITIHSPDRDNVLLAAAYQITDEQFKEIRNILYNAEPAPVPPPSPKPNPRYRVTARVLNERGGPSTNHPIINQHKFGTIIEAQATQQGWIQNAAPSRGWLSLAYLDLI